MFDDLNRTRAALSKAIDQLAAADEAKDEDAIWEASVVALGWLYRADNYLHNNDDAYRAHRDADAKGRTLAGLIWIRGKVDHREGIELLKGTGAGPRATISLVQGDGKPPIPGTLQFVLKGGPNPKLQSGSLHVIEGGRWSWLHQLPDHRQEPATSFYAERVEGRKLLDPMHEAADYLAAAWPWGWGRRRCSTKSNVKGEARTAHARCRRRR